MLQAGAESDTPSGLSPAQVEFDMGYGLVTHEGAGLLTTYGGLSMAGRGIHGVRLGGRIELGEWIDLSVEGECITRPAVPNTKSPSTATSAGKPAGQMSPKTLPPRKGRELPTSSLIFLRSTLREGMRRGESKTNPRRFTLFCRSGRCGSGIERRNGG